MLLLERSVLKEIVLIALLQNESWNKYLMLRVAGQYPNSSCCYLLPLDGAKHFLNIDLFKGHLSQMKFQVNQHYFSTIGKQFLTLFRCILETFFSFNLFLKSNLI